MGRDAPRPALADRFVPSDHYQAVLSRANTFDRTVPRSDEIEWRPGGARVRVVKAVLGANAGAAGAAYAAKLDAAETASL